MGFLKSIKGFLVSIYRRLRENVVRGYEFVSGKLKVVDNLVVDVNTGDIQKPSMFNGIVIMLRHLRPACGSSAFWKPLAFSRLVKRLPACGRHLRPACGRHLVEDLLCANVIFGSLLTTVKSKVIRALSVLGIIGTIAAGIVAIVGKGFSYLLYLKFVALLYAMILVVHLSFSMYSMSIEDRDISYVEPLGGQVSSVIGDTAAIEQTVIAEQAVAEETFDNEFFTSKEEEKKFHYDLADFIRSKKFRPELVYYMFCYEKKAKNTKVDNDMINFLMVPNNSRDVIKFIGRYPKLSSSIMPNGYFDATCSKSFNRYLLPIMFEPNSSLTLARYTKYFYRLGKN